jgi:putative FmdB family regulatory protein
MPIYEYHCQNCGRKSEFLTLRVSEPVPAQCKHCGSDSTVRIPSRVRVRLSEETRLERMADPARFAGLDENDPRTMAKFMKQMGQELGEDLGEDVDAMVEEAMTEEMGGQNGKTGQPSDDEL